MAKLLRPWLQKRMNRSKIVYREDYLRTGEGSGGGDDESAVLRLTNGVFGDGTNDYLQMRNVSGDTLYSYTTPDNFCFEMWFKPPTALAANEGLFASRVDTSTNNNLMTLVTDAIPTLTPAMYGLKSVMYNSVAGAMNGATGALIANSVINYIMRIPQTNATRKNFHIVVRCTKPAANYVFDIFVNGVKANYVTVATKQDPLNFNFLQDRGTAGRFSDGVFMGCRLYSDTITDAEVYRSYNHGRWSEPISGKTLVFDNRLDNRSGNDFIDKYNTGLKLTAVNFATIANNLVTPARSSGFYKVVFAGNSLVVGQGGTSGLDIPNRVFGGLNNVLCENVLMFALGGRTTPQCIALYPTVDAYAYDTSNTHNIYCPWEITNDITLNNVSATDAYNNYVTLCQLAKATGYKVVAATILPRSGGSPPGDFETRRQAINTNIRNNYLTFADALADVGGDANIGAPGADLNVTYYLDGTHMTDAGYAVAFQYWVTAIQALIA